ncbi:adhesin [Pseudomonas yamanorum]|uniref:adhesin n=1 Tax=Pseudomonas yamanorum TaxID=515393 RepID=UPI003D36D100
MSHFSVNNFSRLNNDFNQQSTELPASVDKIAGEKPAPAAGTLLKNNPAVGSDGTVTLNKDALEKLFEMFEYAFKAIRNMLSGQGGMPRLIPDAGPQPKPEREGDAQLKDKAGSHATVLNTALKDKAGTQPEVLNTALKDKAGTQPEVLNTTLKDKAGTQPEVLKTVLKDKAGTNPEVSTQKDTPANNPAVPNSTLTVTPKPQTLTEFRLREPALPKDVQVNDRSNSDVNVTVQVMNCHCPHPDVPNPRAPVPPKPNAPTVLVSPKPDAPVSPKPDAPVPPTPGALVPPSPDAPILPTPDTPTSDVTAPGPAKDDFLLETTGRRRVYDNDWRSHPGRRMSR